MITAVLALVLAAAPASGEALLARAQAQLASADYEPVATTLAPLVGDLAAPAALRARAEVLVGIARHNLLDEPGAERAFAHALALDPGVALPAEASPRTATVFQRVAARAESLRVSDGRPTGPPSGGVVPDAAPDPGGPRIATAPGEAGTDAPSRPRPWLALGGAVVAAALTTTGLVLRAEGVAGRDAAAAEREALVAEARYDEAQSQYATGSALALIGATTAAAALVLWLWPEDAP